MHNDITVNQLKEMHYDNNVADSLSPSLLRKDQLSVSWCSDRQWKRLDGGFVAVFLTCLCTADHHRKTEDFIWYGYACRAALIKEGDISGANIQRASVLSLQARVVKLDRGSLIISSLKHNPSTPFWTPRMCLCCVDVKTSSDAFLLSLTLYGDVCRLNKCH